jgi:hypothetical protein
MKLGAEFWEKVVSMKQKQTGNSRTQVRTLKTLKLPQSTVMIYLSLYLVKTFTTDKCCILYLTHHCFERCCILYLTHHCFGDEPLWVRFELRVTLVTYIQCRPRSEEWVIQLKRERHTRRNGKRTSEDRWPKIKLGLTGRRLRRRTRRCEKQLYDRTSISLLHKWRQEEEVQWSYRRELDRYVQQHLL